MGWFSRKVTDPLWQDVDRLCDIPIDYYSPSFCAGLYRKDQKRLPEPDIRTIMHRMAYLIVGTTYNVSYHTVVLAKWFLRHLDRIKLSDRDKTVMANLHQTLRRNVREYEAVWGDVDTTPFDRLVEMSIFAPEAVLYGAPLGTGALNEYVERYGWRQLTVQNI